MFDKCSKDLKILPERCAKYVSRDSFLSNSKTQNDFSFPMNGSNNVSNQYKPHFMQKSQNTDCDVTIGMTRPPQKNTWTFHLSSETGLIFLPLPLLKIWIFVKLHTPFWDTLYNHQQRRAILVPILAALGEYQCAPWIAGWQPIAAEFNQSLHSY